MSDATPQEVRCGRHPGNAVTTSACRACGTFMCGLCALHFSGANYCPPCWQKQLVASSGSGLRRALAGLFVSGAACLSVVALVVLALVAPRLVDAVGTFAGMASWVLAAAGAALSAATLGRDDVPFGLGWPGMLIGGSYLLLWPALMLTAILLAA